ncbi:MAG: hypothetical protein JW801_19030 [Bacteroidales bacterium]|nr:hypothetical protein [Bacteroidales bacterium]
MKLFIRTLRIVGSLELLLGVIHCAFTPFIMRGIPKAIFKPFLFMFLATGMAFIYVGWILIKESNLVKEGKADNLRIRLTFGFILLAGILAACCMPENPFAWLSLLVAVIGTVLLAVSSTHLKAQTV